MDSEKDKNSCQICGKTFSTPRNRDIHMRTHTGEKPYSCEICGKSFSRPDSKDKHMRTHTGEKPYSCEICNKTFTQYQHKDRHIRTHTKEKPYSCVICCKSFTTAQNKDTHKRTHTGEKPYSCEICGKLFTRKDHKDKHLLTHKDNYNGLLLTIKPVCVKLRKLSPSEIKALSNEQRPDSISEKENLNKDSLLVDLDPINTRCEIKNEVFVESIFTNIMNVKEEIKRKETLANDPLCIKEEPAFIGKADHSMLYENSNEEETLNKDPLSVQIDNITTNVEEKTKAPKSFSCVICSKIFSSIDLLNIHKYVHPLVKEKRKNIEETCKENCISVKEEDVDIYIKEETSVDYLSDNENIYDENSYENIDRIDIEELKLEEPDT